MRRIALIVIAAALVGLCGCPRDAGSPARQPVEPPAPSAGDADTGAWPRTFKDDLGETVTLAEPPERVISLSTGMTEAIFAMGAGARLVGRTDFCEYPPAVRDVPSVGGMTSPSLEAIVAREPDLVVTVRGTPQDVMTSIRRTGVPVIARDPTTVAEVIAMIRDLGRYLGVEEDANALADRLSRRVEAVTRSVQMRAHRQGRPSVLFVIELDPVFVAGEGHFVPDMIELAGGVNATALLHGAEGDQWPNLSLEAVVELDPDVIVTAIEDDEGEPVDGAALLADRPGWRDLDAVQGGRVYSLDPDLAVRAGPRLIDALERMAQIIEDALAGGESGG